MPVQKIMVVGADQMGGEIAQVFAQAGFEVVLRDIEESLVEKGLAVIAGNLQRSIDKSKISEEEKSAIIGRIKGALDL